MSPEQLELNTSLEGKLSNQYGDSMRINRNTLDPNSAQPERHMASQFGLARANGYAEIPMQENLQG